MDYCTWFPEGWWAHCCAVHDTGYVDQIGQAIADAALFVCVASSGDNALEIAAGFFVAVVVFIGVRVFGKRYYTNAKPKE